MKRSAAYRAKYRAELLTAIRACEAVLTEAQRAIAADYRKAFLAMVKAGQRYDQARSIESDAEFDDLSLHGAEPDDVVSSLDDVTSSAVETLVSVRAAFKGSNG